MTSFLISRPAIPASALVVDTTRAYDADYPMYSMFYGERWNMAQLAASAAASTCELTFDLGSGITSAANHLIVGNARHLVSNAATTLYVAGSNDNSVYTDVIGTATDLQSCSFIGPDSQDILFTPTVNDDIAGDTTTAYRYWKLYFEAPSAIRFPVSKVYFGPWFDIGGEVSNYDWEIVSDEVDTWKYPRGNVAMSKSTPYRYRIKIEWDGITDDKATEFQNSILGSAFRDRVFLYTKTVLTPLADLQLLHCRIVPEETEVERQRYADWNVVRAVFEQVV